ncbi:MAG: hypothetical protein ACM3YE_07605 [Bacteroidota bacterium]
MSVSDPFKGQGIGVRPLTAKLSSFRLLRPAGVGDYPENVTVIRTTEGFTGINL